MAGIQHLHIAGIRADTDVEYAIHGARGMRFNALHIAQSTLDSACGLASTLQCLMALLGLPRAQVERISSATREPLRSLWRLARENYFQGTDEKDIEKFADVFAPILTFETLSSTSARRIGTLAAKSIAAGHVPIVAFATRSFSHWTTVVGVEIAPGERFPRVLLVLDPSASRPWGCFYNARLELRTKVGKGRFQKPFVLPYRNSDGELFASHLEAMVVFKRSSKSS